MLMTAGVEAIKPGLVHVGRVPGRSKFEVCTEPGAGSAPCRVLGLEGAAPLQITQFPMRPPRAPFL